MDDHPVSHQFVCVSPPVCPPQECVLMSHYHFFIQIIDWKEFHPTNIPALALVGLFVVQSKDYRGLNWRNCSICLHFDSQSPVLEMIELITLSLGKLNNNVVRKGIKYLCFTKSI